MSQLLIAVLLIATFGVMLGGGITYVDKAGMNDAATTRAIAADFTRITSGIAAYQAATGDLPSMIGWEQRIVPYAPAQVRPLPAEARWVYVAREDGFGLCLDFPQAGPRTRAQLDHLGCATLPERLAGGLVLVRPARTRLLDGTPRSLAGRVIDLTREGQALMNVSDQALRITSIGFPNGAALRVDPEGNGCDGTVLPPAGHCAFGVIFGAAGNGSFAADLTVTAEALGEAG